MTVTVITNVHVGALVVYRSITVTHTGVVRQVQRADGTITCTYCMTGTPTTIESKFGNGGQYEHAPDDVPVEFLPPGGSITYYDTSQARKDAAQGKPDPGKNQHTLKPKCGCLGLEGLLPFFVIWLLKFRKRNRRRI